MASDVVGFTTFILPKPSQLFVLSVPHPFCAFQAARGLDIPSVTTVVHYDVARVIDTFIHRSGRTAVSYFVGFLLERTVPSLNLLVQVHYVFYDDSLRTRVSDFIKEIVALICG